MRTDQEAAASAVGNAERAGPRSSQFRPSDSAESDGRRPRLPARTRAGTQRHEARERPEFEETGSEILGACRVPASGTSSTIVSSKFVKIVTNCPDPLDFRNSQGSLLVSAPSNYQYSIQTTVSSLISEPITKQSPAFHVHQLQHEMSTELPPRSSRVRAAEVSPSPNQERQMSALLSAGQELGMELKVFNEELALHFSPNKLMHLYVIV